MAKLDVTFDERKKEAILYLKDQGDCYPLLSMADVYISISRNLIMFTFDNETEAFKLDEKEAVNLVNEFAYLGVSISISNYPKV